MKVESSERDPLDFEIRPAGTGTFGTAVPLGGVNVATALGGVDLPVGVADTKTLVVTHSPLAPWPVSVPPFPAQSYLREGQRWWDRRRKPVQ
jgi:hypothetical protein